VATKAAARAAASSRRRERRARSCALAALLAAAASGCRNEPGAPYACACSFLTDFDDTSRHDVRVCAPSPERARAIARGCAQMGAPGPVQGCDCRAERGARCETGACTSVEAR